MQSTKSVAGGANQLLHGTTQRMLRCIFKHMILRLEKNKTPETDDSSIEETNY